MAVASLAEGVAEYAKAVVDGSVLAGELVRLAGARHLADLNRTDLVWDAARAEHALEFFPRWLRLAEGDWAGEPFELQPWQQFIVGNLFGWYLPDGTRRFRTAYIEIAKGNGKTPMAAGIGLYGLIADGETAAEVYTAGVTRDQANYILDDARKMVNASPELRTRVEVSVHALGVEPTSSYMRSVSSEARSLDQKRVHMALIDEIHEHRTDEVVTKLRAGTKGRRHALIVETTNSGYDRHSICWRHHEFSDNVLRGVLDNDAWFAFISGLDVGDEWTDETVWPKANPNLDVSISRRYIREQVAEALGMPANQNIVKRLNFNIWTDASRGAIDLPSWDRGSEAPRFPSGVEVYAGLDLASTQDLSSLVLMREDEDGWLDVLPFFWCPEEGIARRSRTDHVPYDRWVADGLLIATPGNVTDYEAIRQKLRDLSDEYRIRELGYDPWNATQLITWLMEDGATCVPVRQGYASMSGPTRDYLGRVAAGTVRHGGHPILRWMAANLVVESDAAGNMKPSKAKSSEKIDGQVAAIMAQARLAALHEGEEPFVSVYESRGIISV